MRGLDYYTRTVFEISSNALGAQSSVCGGGRYDGLVRSLGGPDTPAVGFALGIERFLMVLEALGERGEPERSGIQAIALGAQARAVMRRSLPNCAARWHLQRTWITWIANFWRNQNRGRIARVRAHPRQRRTGCRPCRLRDLEGRTDKNVPFSPRESLSSCS